MLHTYVRRLCRPSRNLSNNLPSLDSCCCCCYHNGNGPKRCSGGPYVTSCQSSFLTPWHGRFVNIVILPVPQFPRIVPFSRIRLVPSTDSPCPSVRRIYVADNSEIPYGLRGFAFTGPGHRLVCVYTVLRAIPV